jgi:hypothetical protein
VLHLPRYFGTPSARDHRRTAQGGAPDAPCKFELDPWLLGGGRAPERRERGQKHQNEGRSAPTGNPRAHRLNERDAAHPAAHGSSFLRDASGSVACSDSQAPNSHRAIKAKENHWSERVRSKSK